MSELTITRDADGSLRIPAELLEELHLAESRELYVAVDPDEGTLRLSAAEDDDAWLYESEEVRQMVARAKADAAAGRVRGSSEEELRALAPAD